MSFLPLLFQRRFLARSHKGSLGGVSPFRRSFNFEIGICFIGIAPFQNFEKQKKPITQSITNQREHRSRFKMMFYVIDFEIQRRVLSQYLLLPTEPKAVEQLDTSGVPIPCRENPTHYFSIWSNIFIQLYMYVWINFPPILFYKKRHRKSMT